MTLCRQVSETATDSARNTSMRGELAQISWYFCSALRTSESSGNISMTRAEAEAPAKAV
jgi:hypothetical protein